MSGSQPAGLGGKQIWPQEPVGNIYSHFLVVTSQWWGEGAMDSSRSRPGRLLNTLQCPGQPLMAENYQAPNVNSAEEPWWKQMLIIQMM